MVGVEFRTSLNKRPRETDKGMIALYNYYKDKDILKKYSLQFNKTSRLV